MCRERGVRRLAACGCAFVLLLVFGLGQHPALGGPIENVIEIDGNPQDDPAAGLDWCCLNDGTCVDDDRVLLFSGRVFDLCPDSPDPGAVASVVCVPAGDKETNSAFTQDTKDGQEIGIEANGDWRHTIKSVPDKDDIVNAMAALLVDPVSGHKILAFAGDRFAVNGDAQIGAWFLQNEVSPNPDGTFSGVHEIDDILILADFTQGGVVSNLQFCLWKGEDNVPCIDVTDSIHAQASSNVGNDVDTCWTYRTKSSSFPSGKYPENGFWSAALDLTGLAQDGVIADFPGCLATFLLETRASQSITARLHDFALGGFDTCADIRGKKEQVPTIVQGQQPDCESIVNPLPDWEIRLYEDLNGDGCPGVCGADDFPNELVTVDGDNAPLANPVTTDALGAYEFANVPVSRNYIVCEIIPATPGEPFFWDHCFPDAPDAGAERGAEFCYIPFELEATTEGKDFRNFKQIPTCEMPTVKFCDEDGDGLFDLINESVEPGFCVCVTEHVGGAPDPSTMRCGVTDIAGQYVVTVKAGTTYSVVEDLTGTACGSEDKSGGWVETTSSPIQVTVPNDALDCPEPQVGNTSIPTCPALLDDTVDTDADECSARYCFEHVGDNVCGEPTTVCRIKETGVELVRVCHGGTPGNETECTDDTQCGGQPCDTWCYDFPGPDPGACNRVTTVVCETTTEATPNVPEDLQDDLTAVCEFDLTVEDNEPPVISDGSADSIKVNDDCAGTVPFRATITDNCCVDEASIRCEAASTNVTLGAVTCTPVVQPDGSVSVTGTVAVSDPTECPGTVTVTFHADDCCGNAATSVSVSANVYDNTPPTITDGSADSIKVGEECAGTMNFRATVDDNCCVDEASIRCEAASTNVTLGLITCTPVLQPDGSYLVTGSVPVSDVTACPGTVTITINADDCCGNPASTLSFSGDVYDNTPPVITDASADSIKVDEDCAGSVPFRATVTDNCCVDESSIRCEAASTNVTLGTVTCTPVVQPDGSVSVTGTVAVSDPIECPGTVTITFHADDCCGNAATSVSVSANVYDNTPPTITDGSADSIKVDEECAGTMNFRATVDDNCCVDEASIRCEAASTNVTLGAVSCTPVVQPDGSYLVTGSVPVSDPSACPGTVTITVYADDCCGNSATALSFNGYVYDNTPPVIFDGSADDTKVDADCSGAVDFRASVTDNCCLDEASIRCEAASTNVTVGSVTCNPVVQPDGSLLVSGSALVSDPLDCPGIVTITIYADDCCGNAATPLSFSASVSDNLPPTITCPAGKGEATCFEEFVFDVTPDDNCDPAPTCDCTFSDPHDPDRFTWRRLGDCRFGVTLSGTTTVTATCTASDACDNTSTECVYDINAVCGQACSPGFWRNLPTRLPEWCDHTPFQPLPESDPVSCEGRGDATLFLDAFSWLSGVTIDSCQPAIDAGSSFYNEMTLYEAVDTSGGADQTLFHCAAALLNSYAVAFPVGTLAVEAVIRDACDPNNPFSWRDAFDACQGWNAVEYEPDGCCPLPAPKPDCPLGGGTSSVSRTSLWRSNGK